MYNTLLNNYHLNPKNSNIYTPKSVSEFLFNLLKDKIKKHTYIIDPCCGQGSLLAPWKETNYKTLGIDNDKNLILEKEVDWLLDFFSLTKQADLPSSVLVLCNPPFNGMKPKLAPEIWLDKIIELFGKDVPIVFFAPIGLRLNLTKASPRWNKFVRGDYPAISSIISLPKNIFTGVKFHCEILIFNIQGLEPHYFYQAPQ